MAKVTVSSKYQVSIPKDVRRTLKIKPGQKIEMLVFQDRLELVPLRPIKVYRGKVKGIDTTVPRGRDRV